MRVCRHIQRSDNLYRDFSYARGIPTDGQTSRILNKFRCQVRSPFSENFAALIGRYLLDFCSDNFLCERPRLSIVNPNYCRDDLNADHPRSSITGRDNRKLVCVADG
ncbi:hypothetical protein PUN28_019214 [Cardiocondyla obscurior]|uniref:Uncharacterized protein n=1 Tax=Cardiocondyla obscurior TaxID=286306 RepID=A0AAW2EAD7_9HYME